MRILIISTFFPPLNSIASLRPYSWAKFWSQAGHDVTVLTTEKNEDVNTSLNMQMEKFNVFECPGPAYLKRLKNKNKPDETLQPSKPSFLKKIFTYLRFKKGVFNAARMPDFSDIWACYAYHAVKDKGPWDLVISTSGPYSVHLIAYMLKKKGLSKKWVADYRDTWSNNYIYPGLFPFNVFERWLEKKILKAADMATHVSEPFAKQFRKLYPFLKVCTIENGFDPQDIKDFDGPPIFPNDGKVRIIHTGSIYLGKRDPSPLFQAIQELNSNQLVDNLEVIFVGPRQSNLEELINIYHVGKWVKIQGFVSREKALQMQREAHALLFLAWNDPTVDGVLTGKIFEYLYARTPILAIGATRLEASQQLILEACAGYAFHTIEEIKKYLVDSLSTGGKETLGYKMEVIGRYDREKLALKLLEFAQC